MMKLQSTMFELLSGRVLSCTLGRKPYRCVWLTGVVVVDVVHVLEFLKLYWTGRPSLRPLAFCLSGGGVACREVESDTVCTEVVSGPSDTVRVPLEMHSALLGAASLLTKHSSTDCLNSYDECIDECTDDTHSSSAIERPVTPVIVAHRYCVLPS